jgi:probable F420-dependent oxidoreductase
MDIGIAIFPSDEAISPLELGPLVEERGFESLWLPEHSHIPVSRRTPYPAGGELPREYARTHDPFVALAAIAAVTTRVRLATGICLLVERDPIITAKETASLDALSGGRFIFGVGAGWNEEEMLNHGTDPAKRFGILRERVEAVREIWTHDEAEYHGRYVDFDPIWCWPKPVQQPGPPVLLGGNGRTVVDRVLAFADGWMPNAVGDEEKLRGRIGRFHDRAREAGRGRLPVSLYAAPPDAAALERYAQAGVDRAMLFLPPAPRDKVEPRLDRYAELIAPLQGAAAG